MRKSTLLLVAVLLAMLLCLLAQAEGNDQPTLLLATASDPLPEDYVPDALCPISTAKAGVNLVLARTELLQEEALEPLYRMMQAAEKAGQTLYIRQAYRSYADEARRYEVLTGMGQAARQPGQSSYQTGRSVTLVGEDWKTRQLSTDFASSEESKWLRAHAAEYGFVLRYPEGKEDVTGWSYEPWHYYYVGMDAAMAMAERGLCLEEMAQDGSPIAQQPASTESPEASGDGEAEVPEEKRGERPRKTDHSVPTVRDPSTIDPDLVGPDGDYEISIDELMH